jgi:hypothetical protein
MFHVRSINKTSQRNLVESKETEIQESENAKITGKTMLTLLFYAICIIHHEVLPEKQIVNSKFYKEVFYRLVAFSLNFWKADSDIFRTTMQRRILWALSPSFLGNEVYPSYLIQHTPLI